MNITVFKGKEAVQGAFPVLGPTQKSREKILRMIEEKPAITIQEIMESLGLSHAGIEKIIRKLKQEGRLKRIGPDKGGYWEVLTYEIVRCQG